MPELTDQLPRLAPVPHHVEVPAGGSDERTVRGVRIHSRVWHGSRTADDLPVVLVHGLVVASDMTAPLAGRLATRQRVLAPDLPGFGRSEQPGDVLDVEALGAVLAAWIQDAAPGGAVLVGNSFGCQVALEAAVQRPSVATALVLAGPTVDRHARSWPAQVLRWQREQATQSWALRRIQLRDYARAGLRRAIGTFRAALADRPEDKVPEIDKPLLVVWGTKDPIVSRRWAGELADAAPRGRLAVLPGARHALAHEDPMQAARVTSHFMDRIATEEQT